MKITIAVMTILLTSLQVSAAKRLPNIVVIMADDFGYGSSNCYGADPKYIKTPNIDRLAKFGMRFTDANTPASICTPTRYAMLTGRYAWRGRLKYGVLSPPEGPLLIEPDLLTLPDYLKKQGYQTAHIGKWHLGYTNLKVVKDMSQQPLEPGPRSLGFDYHFAVPNNLDWLPKVYVENEAIWGLRSKGRKPYGKSSYRGFPYHGYDAPQRVTENVSQELTDFAGKWIAKAAKEKPEKPFFLYFAPVATHIPIRPSDKFKGTSGAGAYGDFIHDLDHSLGGIMRALKTSKVLDNTLVIFTSDNGGDFCPEEEEARKLGFYGNGEFSGDKHTIYQGGLRVPFIAYWPKKIKKGTTTDRMINIVDIHATLQELVSGKVMDAKTAAEDSFSFYSTLVGKASSKYDRETMVQNDVRGVVAIRMGDWKYIENKPTKPADIAKAKKKPRRYMPMLFNLKKDPSEKNNVLKQHPEIAKNLEKRLARIRELNSERVENSK